MAARLFYARMANVCPGCPACLSFGFQFQMIHPFAGVLSSAQFGAILLMPPYGSWWIQNWFGPHWYLQTAGPAGAGLELKRIQRIIRVLAVGTRDKDVP
jgi:hypothetical protein